MTVMNTSLRLLRQGLLAVAGLALAITAWAQSTMVRLHTTQGAIDIQLYDTAAPKTVANFLSYVRSGAYVDNFIHRSMPGFVVQLGGYAWPGSGYAGHITTLPPVVNEFSVARSNVRGTVAMAKLGGDPNSATSEFFFNLGNNASNLDTQNGGFTVFGRVTTPGMAVVDRIAALSTVNAGGAFTNLPVVNFSGSTILREHVVRLTEVTEFPPLSAQSDSDRVFNYLEAAYPQYLSPAHGQAGVASGYTFRYYAGSNAYVATANAKVWYLLPSISPDIGLLGDTASWLNVAAQAGY